MLVEIVKYIGFHVYHRSYELWSPVIVTSVFFLRAGVQSMKRSNRGLGGVRELLFVGKGLAPEANRTVLSYLAQVAQVIYRSSTDRSSRSSIVDVNPPL